MKFSTVFATAASLLSVVNAAPAGASNYNVDLVVESSDSSIDGKHISPMHEGAGINYAVLGDDGVTFIYNSTSKELLQDVGRYQYPFSVQDSVVWFSVVGAQEVDFQSSYLSYNGTVDGFAACKNINDPYNYSKENYILSNFVGGETPEDCVPLKLKVGKMWANS